MINILDVILIFVVVFSCLIGFKQGAIKSTVNFLGLIIAIVLAYILKDPVANFMMSHFSFIDFGGIFKGVTVLNILIYEAIAFLSIFAILNVILIIIVKFSGILEGFLKATIVLGIPSKILGGILGILQGVIYAFVLVFILAQFSFTMEITQTSKFKEPLLNHTPLLTTFAKKTSASINEIYQLKENYKTIDDKNEYNYKAMDILLKNKIISVDTTKKLVEQGKLEINNIDNLIEKYEEK